MKQPKARPDRKHKCVNCGYEWESLEDETAAHIRTAVKVNKDGPFCEMCYHLEMAERNAMHRGCASLADALALWKAARHTRNNPSYVHQR